MQSILNKKIYQLTLEELKFQSLSVEIWRLIGKLQIINNRKIREADFLLLQTNTDGCVYFELTASCELIIGK